MTIRRPVPREDRAWSNEPPRHRVELVVRCSDRRIVVAQRGEPALLTLAQGGAWSAFVLEGDRFRPDRRAGNPSGRAGRTRRLACPVHAEGHTVDGARLRAVLDDSHSPDHVDVRAVLAVR